MTDDLDTWLDDYKPPVITVTVCGRGDLLAAHAEADAALLAARVDAKDMLHSTELANAKRAVEAIEAEIEASQKPFAFRGIGHKVWQDLKRRFPPREDQRRSGMDCDLEKFAAAAIAASACDPEVTAEQSERLARKLPEGEYEKLYEAVLQANGQVMGTPKSVLAALIGQSRQNGQSSTTAALEESPDLSSWVESDDPHTGSSTTTNGD